MAFTRLLEAAREDVQKEVPTPINSTTKSQSQHQPLSNAELCDLFSEFLFDIFDANCMPEFKEIEKLELTHCMLFQDWSYGDEFSLDQGKAHRSFCTLFEAVSNAFLIENNVTHVQLFAAAKSCLSQADNVSSDVSDGGGSNWDHSPHSNATEIWDVVKSVENIEVWADQMKETFERHHPNYKK